MFGSEILDVAIGMTFVYLVFSLICSAVNELIEGFLKYRASDLERGIRELIEGTQPTGLAEKIYNHGLIYGLFKGAYKPPSGTYKSYGLHSKLPSYIPARNFALALMDVLAPGDPNKQSGSAGATGGAPGGTILGSPPQASRALMDLRAAVSDIPDSGVRTALITLVDAGGGDIGKVRENIEGWFNSAMDRVSGWYKRRSQVFILIIGLIIAGSLNVDSINIATALSTNKAMRDSLVESASEYAKQQGDQQPDGTTGDAKARYQDNLNRLQSLGLPIGWKEAPDQVPGTTPDQTGYKGEPLRDPRWNPASRWGWFFKFVGLALTAAAASLGAPFWFDMLNKFIVVRSTVKPHEKSPEEPSKQ